MKLYIKFITLCVWAMIAVLKRFMLHLINLKGLDPNADPELNAYKFLKDNLEFAFINSNNEDNFSKFGDDDFKYDYSWAQKKFKEVHELAKWGDITKEEFMDLTDVSNISAPETKVKMAVTKKSKKINNRRINNRRIKNKSRGDK
jgi:hypothetical protein